MAAPHAQHDPFRLCGTMLDGKYRVVSAVGAGGFGVVYRGEHEGFGAPIAIKCLRLPDDLPPEMRDDSEASPQIFREFT